MRSSQLCPLRFGRLVNKAGAGSQRFHIKIMGN